MSSDTMPDLCYMVVCNDVNPDNEKLVYQSYEPERQADTSWLGGFSIHIVNAILYANHKSAQKVRNRMAKYYPEYSMKVISKETKEIFVERLAG